MPDLSQQIRERLDGLGPGPAVDVGFPEPVTPEEREQWREAFVAEFAKARTQPLKILPSGQRFYPGFELLRDALLAVVDLEHDVRVHGLTIIPTTGEYAGCVHEHAATQRILGLAVTTIAAKLGIDVTDA